MRAFLSSKAAKWISRLKENKPNPKWCLRNWNQEFRESKYWAWVLGFDKKWINKILEGNST